MRKKIFYLISKEHYSALVKVISLIFFSSIIEVFSLGLIVPLMYSIVNPEIFNNSTFWVEFFSFLGIIKHENKINFFLILLIVFFALKTFSLIFVNNVQN